MKKANGAGEHMLAIEIGEQLVSKGSFKDKVPVLQQKARALAIIGSSGESRAILEGIPPARADEAETLGLLARVWKDLAVIAEDAEESKKCFVESLASYVRGFDSAVASNDSDGAAYCGINAAAVAVWLGDATTAADYAEKAFARSVADTGYYGLAARAEASLILGREEEARTLYSRACLAGEVQKRWADIASTRKQCRALCLKLHGRRDHFDGCFSSGAVAALSGQAAAPGCEYSGDFACDRIRAWLTDNQIRHAFVGVLAGWDLILAGVCLEMGIETHLIVPPGDGAFLTGCWKQRFDAATSRATSVTVLSSGVSPAGKGMANFTGRMVAARGALLAGHLGVSLKALAVGEKPELSAASSWSALNLETFAIHPGDPDRDGIPDKDAPPDPVPFRRTMAPVIDREPVVALLHLHFAGYTLLEGEGFEIFRKAVVDTLAANIASSDHPPVLKQGLGGDYLFVFEKLHPTATAALSLLSALHESLEGTVIPLPSMCLHAGPVGMDVNTLLNIYEPAGDTVSRASQIAAALPPGAVCATETFTALSILESLHGFRFEHSGNIETPGRSDRLFRLHPTSRK